MVEKVISQAWYQDQAWIKLFSPLSHLYLRQHEKRKRIAIENRRRPFAVPVVVVGNITVGGTGKTPLIIYLANALRDRGIRVGVISRGYGGQPPQEPYIVSQNDDPSICGDEPLLISKSTCAPVVIGRDRSAAAEKLLQNDVQLVLSDDGLQHYALPRQYEIAVVDGERYFGNGRLLPAGPLREPIERLENVDFIVRNGGESDGPMSCQNYDIEFDASYRMAPSGWVNVQSGTRVPLDFIGFDAYKETVHAIAGIGNPSRFFSTLGEFGIDVTEHIFPDHHRYTEDDFSFVESMNKTKVLMTTKDALKCRDFAGPDFWALDIDLAFDNTASGQDSGDFLLLELQNLLARPT